MEEMRAAGVKDLEITFVGMAFVIQGALKVIKSAIQTVNKIEKVPCIWILMVFHWSYIITLTSCSFNIVFFFIIPSSAMESKKAKRVRRCDRRSF